jgi:hypothetical protein
MAALIDVIKLELLVLFGGCLRCRCAAINRKD